MSNQADINNYITGDINGLNNISFTSGAFNFTTGEGSSFYLFSPQILDTTRTGGRYGQDLQIDASKASKYRYLSIRMFTDTPDTGGFRIIVNRGTDYVPNRTVSEFIPILPGWRTYRVDLGSLPIYTAGSSNTAPWTTGSITGLSIHPTTRVGANVAIDFIKLEDLPSCATTNATYTSTTSGNDGLYSLYLDEDSDPTNGYSKKLVSGFATAGAETASFTLDGLQPGIQYKVVGQLHSDYALLERDDPWDMNQATDISLYGGVNSAAFAGGSFSGVTTGAQAAAIYLDIPADKPINAAKYSKLSLKMTRPAGGLGSMFWTNNVGGSGALVIDPATHDSNHDDVFEIDLAGQAGWTGSITQLILRPSVNGGAAFSIDFASLRAAGFVSTLSTSGWVTSPSTLEVNAPPVIDIFRPSEKGGEEFRPWNMNPNDVVLTTGLRSDADPQYPGEKYTTYLPDVRSIDGVRGDIFKGTNALGNDDPVTYLTFPQTSNASLIDTSVYKNVCIKALTDHPLDVCLGSIIKPVWLNEDGTFTDVMASISIFNRWSSSRWYEYCFDLPTVNILGAGQPWTGTKRGLRVDPHEFAKDTCGPAGTPVGNPTSTPFYYDFVRLTKDATADTGKMALIYKLTDPDDNATMTFYYSPNRDGGGSTMIASGLPKTESTYIWDTSAVPNGTYYLFAIASDSFNSTTRFAKGRFVVNNGGSPARANPVLSLQAPVSGGRACDSLQVKGYSLLSDKLEPVSGVEVRVDGSLARLIQPDIFSPAAVAAYAPTSFESSNSGFNELVDVTGLSAGAHSVEIKSIAPDGGVTSSGVLPFTKLGAGCADPIVDPLPAGAPSTVVVPDGSPAATPTPNVPSIRAPLIRKVALGRDKLFTLMVSQAKETGRTCSFKVKIGANATLLNVTAKTYTPPADAVTLTVAGIGANNKKLPKFYLTVEKNCGGAIASAAVKTISTKAASGSIDTVAKMGRALARLAVPKPKRRTRR